MQSFLSKYFGKKEVVSAVRRTPAKTRIYAIGDIHGRADLLDILHEKIIIDAQDEGFVRAMIIYLGDYVDRGLQSSEVIEKLSNHPLYGFENYYLIGNHEIAMLDYLKYPEESASWLMWGGDATLQSYGVIMRGANGQKRNNKELSAELNEKLPFHHLEFLKSLKNMHIEGGYLFVHAGLRPNIGLNEQGIRDMTMIRDDFIESNYDFGYDIVFGHTIFKEPFHKNGRYGVDTGAFATGKLTAIVLQDNNVRYLST